MQAQMYSMHASVRMGYHGAVYIGVHSSATPLPGGRGTSKTGRGADGRPAYERCATVAVAASLGALDAPTRFLSAALPADSLAPSVVVPQVHPRYPETVAGPLGSRASSDVKEAEADNRLRLGSVHVASTTGSSPVAPSLSPRRQDVVRAFRSGPAVPGGRGRLRAPRTIALVPWLRRGRHCGGTGRGIEAR